jgi:putative polyhydroxyalkanoate system protein
MANIHIERAHGMGLAEARQTARQWAAQAEEKYQLQGRYDEGQQGDTFSFQRTGVSGTMRVTDQAFTLDAKLGFLMGAFKPQIEAEMVKKIDALIARAVTASNSTNSANSA